MVPTALQISQQQLQDNAPYTIGLAAVVDWFGGVV